MHDIPVLMLHTVNRQKEKNPMGVLSVSPEGLDAYLRVFRKWHYQMISMTDLLEGRYDPEQNFVVLTFDDGFKDNLTVARPVLEKYHAHATIFVNPDYLSEESDPDSDWGFMTWDEVKEAENTGVFDIQAHTMTHEFIFTSDQITDFYTPDKFNRYYWLAWMLFPDAPRKWNGSANRYREMIPTGYPVFEYGRRIAYRKFIPDSSYIDYCTETFRNGGQADGTYDGPHGVTEDETEYRRYVDWEIRECKRILEEKLGKTINTLCFPGGGYTEEALSIAGECGYRCYMISSSLREGNNFDHLDNIRKGTFDGLNRTAFSVIHPGILPDTFFDQWIAKLSLGTYQNMPGYMLLKRMLSKIWHT